MQLLTSGRPGGVLPWGVLLLLALLPAGAAAEPRTPTPAARIAGGTTPNRPWPAQGYLQVALPGGVERVCGGTLVSGRWFLTAGHCVTARASADPLLPAAFTVNLGESDTTQFTATERFAVDRVVRDPFFSRRVATSNHDLALLHLARATPATPGFEPMRIVSASESALWSAGTVATVIGWGASVVHGPLSTRLQQAGVPILEDTTCNAAYPVGEPDPFDVLTMLCAGDGSADTCTGDSGGPLMVPRVDTFALAGVTSYGGLECASATKPGVYARVGSSIMNAWVRTQIPTASIAIDPARPEPDGDVALAAGASRPDGQTGLPAYRWDLDDDGAYDDDAGPNATLRNISRGSTVVRVQESYPDGDRALAREVVTTAGSPLPLPPPPPPPPPRSAVASQLAPPAPAPGPAAAPDPAPATAIPAPAQPSSIALPALARLLPGPRRMYVRSLLDRRMTIRVHCSVACTMKARFTLDWRTARRLRLTRSGTNVLIGTGARRLRGAGSVKLTIRLTKRAVRALRRAHRGATRVRVTATAGQRRQRLDRTITLHA